jgi:hypothetical protein
MSKLPPHQLFVVVVSVVLVLLLCFSRGRAWLKGRFKTFDFLPDYFEATRLEFSNVFWGVGVGAGVPFLIYAIYSQFAYPPPFVNWLAILGAVFLGGYYLWRADHLRLEKNLIIRGDLTHSWPLPEDHTGTQYYFKVLNVSESLSVHNIRVRLDKITPECPDIKTPVLLHHQHDAPIHYEDFVKSFDLNPKEPNNIDLITWSSHNDFFNVTHVSGAPGMEQSVKVLEGRILTVEITASDAPSISANFRVFLNESGVIQCQMEHQIRDPNLKSSMP